MNNDFITLPRELANYILQELYDYRGEISWWQDEPRCNYQRNYQLLCDEIKQLEEILAQNSIIKLKNTPEQQELLLEVIKNNELAKDTMSIFLESVYKQVINELGLNKIQCDWMPTKEIKLQIQCEFPVIIYKNNKT